VSDPIPNPEKRKRRPRYSGKNPRHFHEKYKELDPANYRETVEKVLASGKTPAGMHRPIMVQEILECLHLAPGQIGIDCTIGFGGHAQEILKHILPGGRLIGLDADPIEIEKTIKRFRDQGFNSDTFNARNTNFAAVSKVLSELSVFAVDFILADLGVSSMQLDDPQRGFSYKLHGPLDLRMNPTKGRAASEVLQNISCDDLEKVLRENADEIHAREIAEEICSHRTAAALATSQDLRKAIESALKSSRVHRTEVEKTIRRVFQAIRILVNNEFETLEQLLRVAPSLLKPHGRMAILTFHSGEDRRVKKRFQEFERAGLFSKTGGPLTPTPAEVRDNPRSASAKLRWAIKNPSTGTDLPG
jgi:16S rRNA (cytosine1402-N4)-methyltransferase